MPCWRDLVAFSTGTGLCTGLCMRLKLGLARAACTFWHGLPSGAPWLGGMTAGCDGQAGATMGSLMGALVKIGLLLKYCWMLLPTWLWGGSLKTTGVVATAATTAHVASLNIVDVLGIQGCLSWWGLRGWPPKGVGQNLGRGTPERATLGICVCWQTELRLPRRSWPEREGMGNGGLELKVPCRLLRVREIMLSRLWGLLGGIFPGFRMFWRSPALGDIMCWLDGGLALVKPHLEVTCSWMATEREKWGQFQKCPRLGLQLLAGSYQPSTDLSHSAFDSYWVCPVPQLSLFLHSYPGLQFFWGALLDSWVCAHPLDHQLQIILNWKCQLNLCLFK